MQREQEHLRREVEERRRENQVEMERVKVLGIQTRANLRRAEDDLTKIDSREGQQLSHLRKINHEVAKGWEWLQEHRDEFEKEIFGPPMLTCSVKDKKYSNLIQGMLQADDFLCFTTQCKADHTKLSAQFYKTMGLSVTIRSCATAFASFRSPLSREELASLGLDGFAIDYLDGPEPVLAMLCADRKLHAAAVGVNETTDDQYDRIVKGDKLITWASGRLSYRITRRREYGAGAVSTSTKGVPPGRFWTDEPVATAEKRQLTQKRDEINDHFKQLASDMNALRATDREVAEEFDTLSAKIVRCPGRLCFTLLMDTPERAPRSKEPASEGAQPLACHPGQDRCVSRPGLPVREKLTLGRTRKEEPRAATGSAQDLSPRAVRA